MARFKKPLTFSEYKSRDYLWSQAKRFADPKCKSCDGKGTREDAILGGEFSQGYTVLCGCLRKSHIAKTNAKAEQDRFDAEMRQANRREDERIKRMTGEA